MTSLVHPQRRSRANFITRPFWLVIIPAVLSFTTWVLPWPAEVRRGFTTKEELTGSALVAVVTWYALIAALGTFGWLVGQRVEPAKSVDSANDDRVYRILTLIAAAGVLGMYMLVLITAPGVIAQALQTQQFNLVREAVPLAPGVATLRYASILAGAIALHRLVALRERRGVHFFNVALLVMNVIVASRLALIMTVLIFVCLLVTRPRAGGMKVNKTRLVVVAALVMGLLTWANYLRNANFYETYYGTRNPYAMIGSEVVTYLGAPFQVSIATPQDRTVKLSANDRLGSTLGFITPTFFKSAGDESTETGMPSDWYRGNVSIENGLTTNSALALLYGRLGFAGAFAFMAFVAVAAGFLMGHFSRYRSYMALGAFVVGYCFAEMWRTYLFADGIVWFLLLALWFACWQSQRRPDWIRRQPRERTRRGVPQTATMEPIPKRGHQL